MGSLPSGHCSRKSRPRRGHFRPSRRLHLLGVTALHPSSVLSYLRLHFRARGAADPVQPEHAVVLTAGQLLSIPVDVLLTALGHTDAIKVHHSATGARDDVYTPTVALYKAVQAFCCLVAYPARAQGLVAPAQPELREKPVTFARCSARRPIHSQLDRSDELVGVSRQVSAVIGTREASERLGSSSSGFGQRSTGVQASTILIVCPAQCIVLSLDHAAPRDRCDFAGLSIAHPLQWRGA